MAGGLTYLLLVFIVMPLVLRRRTGHSGWLLTLGLTTTERLANILFVVAWVLALANPGLVLAGAVAAPDLPASSVRAAAGIAVLLGSAALAVLSQRVMGPSWRTGVDQSHTSELVTAGPFRFVRNPIYTSMVGCLTAMAVLVPTLSAVLSLALCVGSLQMHTRLLEEPHLLQVHGAAFNRYAARTGRYLPLLGRFRMTPG